MYNQCILLPILDDILVDQYVLLRLSDDILIGQYILLRLSKDIILLVDQYNIFLRLTDGILFGVLDSLLWYSKSKMGFVWHNA